MAYPIVSQPSNSKRLFSYKNLFKISFPCFTPTPTPTPTPSSGTGTGTTKTNILPAINGDTMPPLVGPSNGPGPQHENGLKEVFDHLDADKDGKVSSKEIMDYFASLGGTTDEKVGKRVIDEFDSDGDELLDLEDFIRLMKEEEGGEFEDILRSAFGMFEVEKGCGCITPKGLQNMLRQLGDVKSHDECAAMIRPFDLDANGFLDFHEFHHMMSQS